MSSSRKSILTRFGIIYFLIILLFALVVYRIFVIQYIEKNKWLELAEKTIVSTDAVVEPNRGNIFSSDGQLMASSIPYYYIIMDTRVPNLHSKEHLFLNNVDSLSLCLSRKFKDRTPDQYKTYLTNAYKRGDGRLFLYPGRISYSDLKEVKSFPLFRLGGVKGGLIAEERLQREKPFGSLASRTIGDIYGERTLSGGYGRSGIELTFDSLLQGKQGVASVQKVANKRLIINKIDPEDGLDLTTTIDIDMQDIAEKSLLDMLQKIDADRGCVILMDVKSGEVKACVNMKRKYPGVYGEDLNMAVGDMSEPGSTFKTFSLMVALEDEVADVNDSINTYDGVFKFHGVEMRDHNYKLGGYGKITLAQSLAYSSNIGVSRVIMENYAKKPSDFVDKLYKMGLNVPLNLEIPGAGVPYIRHPNDVAKKWSSVDLAWMSIGYVLQIPPIYMLAFYNAIANDGRFIRPFFVKNVMSNGDVIKRYSTEVVKERICSKSVLEKIRHLLEEGVEYGTGMPVKSTAVKIAGKTGTAQLNYNGSNGGQITHQVSFCGYFPADKPLYSGIVVIREPRWGYPSGGTMSGVVFKNMAEQIYARKVTVLPEEFAQSNNMKKQFPIVKKGNYKALKSVLSELDIPFVNERSSGEWVSGSVSDDALELSSLDVTDYLVPNVVGMGAKDAVFLMERTALKVKLSGTGKVWRQSLEANTKPIKGQTVYLDLK